MNQHFLNIYIYYLLLQSACHSFIFNMSGKFCCNIIITSSTKPYYHLYLISFHRLMPRFSSTIPSIDLSCLCSISVSHSGRFCHTSVRTFYLVLLKGKAEKGMKNRTKEAQSLILSLFYFNP